MKILWFTNTPSNFNSEKKHIYNGGGWIESLETVLSKSKSVNLGIAFQLNDSRFKVFKNNVTYYPIKIENKIAAKVHGFIFTQQEKKTEIEKFQQIIVDFKPDIIHVFGSESNFGLIVKHTNIPVVLHIQGIINPYLNAWFPPSFSFLSLFWLYKMNLINTLKLFREYKSFKKKATTEKQIFQSVSNFMGRTEWDKNVIRLMAPNANYFHCDEVLRPLFYNQRKWEYKAKTKITIVSTISSPLYKGFDLILKTAKVLNEFSAIEFEWNVFGATSFKHIEQYLKLSCSTLNINLKGSIDAVSLVDELLNADIFIHPSYIDNSPNSVCEAQILGLPVIATNVGGVSSLITDRFDGILTPANDPYSLAKYVIDIVTNQELSQNLGENARKTAEKRHDQKKIVADLLEIYTTLSE